MNLPKLNPLLVLLLFGLRVTALAQTAPAESVTPPSPPSLTAEQRSEAEREKQRTKLLNEKRQVRVNVLMVSLPQAAGLELLPDLRDASKIEAACKRLTEMIAHNQARLIAWPEIVTKSGERGVTEGILEERYPTEFDPPQSPEKKNEPPKANSPKLVPTAFETRNTGVTLEAETVVAPDGSSILVNLVPQYVGLVEMKTFFTGKNAAGEELHIDQPRFRTMKTTMGVSLRSGQRMLIATFPDQANEALAFFILQAEILPPN